MADWTHDPAWWLVITTFFAGLGTFAAAGVALWLAVGQKKLASSSVLSIDVVDPPVAAENGQFSFRVHLLNSGGRPAAGLRLLLRHNPLHPEEHSDGVLGQTGRFTMRAQSQHSVDLIGKADVDLFPDGDWGVQFGGLFVELRDDDDNLVARHVLVKDNKNEAVL